MKQHLDFWKEARPSSCFGTLIVIALHRIKLLGAAVAAFEQNCVRGITVRKILALFALIALAFVLLLELASLIPYAQNFHPTDYEALVEWGRDARVGKLNYLYPLPALLYIFVPLSLLPWWFKFVWAIIPFAFVLYIHRQKGLGLFLFLPMLAQAAWGTLDGYFLLPLYWLFNEQAGLAGYSAAVLLLKPQLAVFTVPYIVLKWFREKNYKSLRRFVVGLTLLFVPSFIVDPLWVIKMIPAIEWRQSQWFIPIRNVTLWSWWWHGGWTVLALPLLAVLVSLLFIRAFRVEPVKSLHLLGLTVVPAFFVVSLDTSIATLRSSWRDILAISLVSWFAFGLDAWFAWGGVYAIISLAALWLIGNRDAHAAMPIVQEKKVHYPAPRPLSHPLR